MVPGLEAELARLAPAALLDCVLGSASDRDARVRQVRDQGDELAQLLLHGGVVRFHFLQLLPELGALAHQRGRLRLVLLRLRLADLLGESVALRLQLLGRGLDLDHFFFAATPSRRRSSASFSRIAASSPRSVGTYQPGASIPSGK